MSRRTHVLLRDTAPSRSAPTFTGVGFAAAITERGVFNPQQPSRSPEVAVSTFGARQSYSTFGDWCELFYREGGRDLHVSPVRGPAAAPASLNIAGTGTTIIATVTDPDMDLPDPGEWGNGATGGYSVQVANGPSGGTHRVLIVLYGGVEVGRTTEFSDRTAVNGVFVDRVKFTLGGGSGLPTVAVAANFTGGTLDRLNILQAHVDAALALMGADLGPGQVASPDWQTTAAHNSLLAHAEDRNRFALCDTTDTSVKATVSTLGNATQGDVDGPYGALAHPWVKIRPSAPGGAGRSVPLSAFVAAKANQVDQAAGPNQAPAGEYGRATSSLVTGLAATYSDSDAADLEAVGVNLAIVRNGEVRFDGNRTLVEPGGADAEWLQIGNSRFRMALVAEASVIGQSFEHLEITPITIAKFDTALTGMMMLHADSLFPGDDDPGFIVDTGDSVNTPESIEAGQLSAAIGFRPAPGADMVFIYLTKVAVGEPVG